VSVPSGETVTFAPGTFSGGTVVTLKVYDAGDVPAAPAGEAVVAHAIDLKPEGVIFDPPAVITLPYDDGQLAGADASTLAVWVYLNGSWQRLGGTVDAARHTVSISVPHFTLYALMASPPVAPRGAPAGTGLPNSGAGAADPARSALATLALLIAAAGVLSLGAGLGRRTG